MAHTMTTIGIGPLVAAVEAKGGLAACGAAKGVSPALRQAYYRARKTGQVSMVVADDLCVKLLGLHPVELWGDEWVACALG